MLHDAVVERLHQAGGEALLLDRRHDRVLVADTSHLVDLCRNLRHFGFTQFTDYTGEHLGGDVFALRLVLRIPVEGYTAVSLKWKFTQTAAAPAHPSLCTVWPAAGIAEREMFEMFGLAFAGNEHLTPLLLEEQFPGNPLRKDYAPPAAPPYATELLRERHEAGMLSALNSAATEGQP